MNNTKIYVHKVEDYVLNESLKTQFSNLSDFHQNRVNKYKNVPDKVNAIESAILLKTALSDFHIGEHSLKYRFSPHGKPEFANIDLYFSITHCDGLVAVAISDCPVGIDAESLSRQIPDYLSVKYDINTIPQWTKAESLLKCKGVGLSGLDELDYQNYFFRHFETDGFSLSVCSVKNNIDSKLKLI